MSVTRREVRLDRRDRVTRGGDVVVGDRCDRIGRTDERLTTRSHVTCRARCERPVVDESAAIAIAYHAVGDEPPSASSPRMRRASSLPPPPSTAAFNIPTSRP